MSCFSKYSITCLMTRLSLTPVPMGTDSSLKSVLIPWKRLLRTSAKTLLLRTVSICIRKASSPEWNKKRNYRFLTEWPRK
jgi:hypothetical protein